MIKQCLFDREKFLHLGKAQLMFILVLFLFLSKTFEAEERFFFFCGSSLFCDALSHLIFMQCKQKLAVSSS